jgi:hypothetical protein
MAVCSCADGVQDAIREAANSEAANSEAANGAALNQK